MRGWMGAHAEMYEFTRPVPNSGHFYEIAESRSILADDLSSGAYRPTVQGGRVAVAKIKSWLAEYCHDEDAEIEKWTIPTGLWDVVNDVLQDNDRPPVDRQKRNKEFLNYPAEATSNPRSPLLGALRDDELRITYEGAKVSLVGAVADLVASLPKARIVVADHNIRRLRELARVSRRRGLGTDEYDLVHSASPLFDSPRVVFGTYSHLADSVFKPKKCHVLICPDAGGMFTQTAARAMLRHEQSACLVGFADSGKRRSKFEEELLAAHFGLDPVVLTAQRRVQRTVVAGILELNVARPERTESRLDLLDSGIWRHRARNAQLARIAVRAAQGDLTDLQRVIPGIALRPPRRVAILVANLRQAASLLRETRLKDWSLVTSEYVAIDALSSEDQRRVGAASEIASEQSQGTVVTAAGLRRAGRVDLLIRADGGRATLPSSWIRGDGNTDRRRYAVVVDVLDRHHDSLHWLAGQRIADYVRAGWRLPGLYPRPVDVWRAKRAKGIPRS